MGYTNVVIQPVTALALATSAENAVRTGVELATNLVDVGTILVLCQASLTSASVTATFVPQVSPDATNWYDMVGLDQVERPVAATGTGSLVVTNIALSIPVAAISAQYFRCLAILGAAATASGDQTAVVYQYCPATLSGLYGQP